MPTDKRPLNHAPVPLRTMNWVLVNECKGDWAFAPANMLNISEGQLKTLGKLYDWRFVRDYANGVPQRFLKTNDSTLNPLLRKGLIRVTRGGYYSITEMGRRVYDLNYWHRHVSLEEMRQKRRELREARQRFMYGGSLTRR